MPYTFDELRAKYPKATDAEIREAVTLLNKPVQTLRQIWESEAQTGHVAQATTPDGLTRPMRELNRFADENALPLPFPPAT